MEKRLTIVIPTYNMEAYLDRCLSSLVMDEEHMSLLDVIVVNDGSKDKSSEIAHKYASDYPDSVRVIDKENGNYGSCINRGLKEGVGVFIKILDADDMFENLVEFLDFLEDKEGDVIFSQVKTIAKNKISDSHIPLPESTTFAPSELTESVVRNLFMHNITYRLDMIRSMDYKQTEGISYTDLEWSFYPISKAKVAHYFPNTVYVYDISRDGQTVQPEKHCKNMWMEVGVVEKMLKQYEQMQQDCTKEAKSYLSQRLTAYVKRIYEYYLIIYPTMLDNADLIAFDASVKLNAPNISSALDKVCIDRKLIKSFAFIRTWRKKQSRNSLRYRYFDTITNFGVLLRKIIR